MGQYSKSSEKNIFKHKEDFTWTETDVVKDGRKMRIVVPDGKVGYGDTESHAQLTGDLAAKHSDDTKAGEKAYESAREQSQQDWQKRKKQMAYQKMKAQMPLMKQYTIIKKIFLVTINLILLKTLQINLWLFMLEVKNL